uniref:Uncharacterized protein n=1 Tax=Cucumis melo TaxID=3656 RepID=A0A9I9ELY2_CUCME
MTLSLFEKALGLSLNHRKSSFTPINVPTERWLVVSLTPGIFPTSLSRSITWESLLGVNHDLEAFRYLSLGKYTKS